MSTRTNIVIDDDLVAQAMVKARVNTKKAAVEAALRAYVRKPDYSGLLALRGQGVIDDDYDPKGLFGLTEAALARRGRVNRGAVPPSLAANGGPVRPATRAAAKSPRATASRRAIAPKRRERDAA